MRVQCPECKRFVSLTPKGKVMGHEVVHCTGSHLEYKGCPGSGKEIPSEVDRLRAEVEKLRTVLVTISQWDSLNPPAPNSDFPWLRKLVDDALA